EPDATSFRDFSNREWQIGVVLDIKDIRIHAIVLDIDINGTNTQSRNVPTSRGSNNSVVT
ncbi:hypothetical protein Tco_1006003, partial [Tanacetum coccineum]